MDFYKKNLAFFSGFPNLQFETSRLWEHETLRSREEDFPVLSLYSGSQKKLLNSRYSVQKESSKWAEAAPKSSLYLIAGLGTGEHIKHLKNRFPDSCILVLEPDPQFIPTLCKYYDFSSLFGRKGIFFIPESQQILDYAVGGLHDTLRLLVAPGYMQLFANKTENLCHDINLISNRIASDWITQKVLARKWYRNFLLNTRLIGNTEFAIKKKVRKVIVCGAGPDLENLDCDTLDSDCLIIAADTALGYFTARSITPDIIISIDGRNISYLNFIKSSANTCHVFDPCSAHFFVRKVNPVLFAGSGFPLLHWFNDRIFSMPFLESSAGNVGAACLQLATQFTPSIIVVYGMTFSYPHGDPYVRESYAYKYFHYTQNRLETHLSRQWKFLTRSNLQYDRNKREYSSELLDNYKKHTLDILIKYEYQEDGDRQYRRIAPGSGKTNLRNQRFMEPDFATLLENLRRVGQQIKRPEDFHDIALKDRQLFAMLCPLLLHYSNLDLEKRIDASLDYLGRLVTQIT